MLGLWRLALHPTYGFCSSRPTGPGAAANQLHWQVQPVTGIRRAVGAGTWAVLDQALFAGANFVLTVLLARWLGEAGFGVYSLAYTIFLLISMAFTALLIDPLLVYGAVRWQNAFHQYLARVLVGLGLLSCAAAIMFVTLSQFSHLIDETHALRPLLLTFSWAGPIILMMWVLRRSLYAVKKPNIAAAGGAIYLVSLLAMAVSVHDVRGLTAQGAIVIMAIASLVTTAFLWKSTSGRRSKNGTAPLDASTREVLLTHWRYGRWLLGWYILDWLGSDILYLVLAPIHGPASVGTLRAAITLIMPAQHVYMAVSSVAVPWFVTRLGSKELPQKIIWYSCAMLFMGALYTIVLLGLGRSLIAIFYGETFTGIRPIVGIVAFIPCIMAIQSSFGAVLRAMNRTRDLFMASGATAVLTATFGAWLCVTYGTAGAASAFLIGIAANTGALALIIRRRIAGGIIVQQSRVRAKT